MHLPCHYPLLRLSSPTRAGRAAHDLRGPMVLGTCRSTQAPGRPRYRSGDIGSVGLLARSRRTPFRFAWSCRLATFPARLRSQPDWARRGACRRGPDGRRPAHRHAAADDGLQCQLGRIHALPAHERGAGQQRPPRGPAERHAHQPGDLERARTRSIETTSTTPSRAPATRSITGTTLNGLNYAMGWREHRLEQWLRRR